MSNATHYPSKSQGPVLISSMAYPHLVSAIRTREREVGGNPDEILDAMRARVAGMDSERNAGGGGEQQPVAAAQGNQLVCGGLGGGVGRESRKLERTEAAGIGDNNPPADPFTADLEQSNEKLLNDLSDHELAAARLPASVQSDEDVAAITSWVVKARQIYSSLEKARETAKAPYLENGRKVDGFFNTMKEAITTRAKSIEQRSTAYLRAKAVREQAERDAAAAAARQEEAKRQEAARAAREAEEKARRDAQAAEQAIRDAATKTERDAAAKAAQEASEAAAKAKKDAEEAEKARLASIRTTDKAERQADGSHRLERTATDAGAARLIKAPKYRIGDEAELIVSMGPLGRYLTPAAINDALARASREVPPPAVPGVVFWEEEQAATSARRN